MPCTGSNLHILIALTSGGEELRYLCVHSMRRRMYKCFKQTEDTRGSSSLVTQMNSWHLQEKEPQSFHFLLQVLSLFYHYIVQ